MSEHLNNPEHIRKNLMDDCSGCGERYLLESSTVDRAYWFSDSPRHSFAQCQCPNCNYRTIIFIDDFGKEALTQHGVEINEKITTPPKNVIDIRAQVDAQNAQPQEAVEAPEEAEAEEYPELPTYELTPRMEGRIERFSRSLGHYLYREPDVFWQEMNSPHTDKPYPQRWI